MCSANQFSVASHFTDGFGGLFSMKLHDGFLLLSASDLVGHLNCRHLTNLEVDAARGRIKRPHYDNASLQPLFERGAEHEKQFVEHLQQNASDVVHIDTEGLTHAHFEQTFAAMRAGAQVIVQGVLQSGGWRGRTDILQRVERPSSLGNWSYEVTDTKLSRETKGGTILQLCLYSDLLTDVQGVTPGHMYVVTPGTDFKSQKYRFGDFAAYYRSVRAALLQSVDQHENVATYPEPQEYCEICRWAMQCDARRRGDDHLSLVAGISKIQTAELRRRDVTTTTRLAEMPIPISWKPDRGVRQSYERVREQARVQVASRGLSKPLYELIPPAADIGLALLPSPSIGDIFFDLEGDPFIAQGGLEYLFGYVWIDDDGAPRYEHTWAFTRDDERAAFEQFIDFVVSRRKQYPELHIYHYAPYEPAALKRLMGRYATREDEIDRLLRAGVFVDLYSVVKQAIRAGVESYSIKRLEPFYEFDRPVDLKDARVALMTLQTSLELGEVPLVTAETKQTIAGYNRDDCISALRLRNWLELRRAELVARGVEIARPTMGDENPSEKVKARQAEIDALVAALTSDLPADAAARTAEQQARWVLAGALGWHRREDKPVFWEKFRLADLDDAELLEDVAGLAWLNFEKRVGGTAKCPIDQYRFPPQESSLRGGENVFVVGGSKFGEVVRICFDTWTVDIKKRQDSADTHPSSIFAHDHVEAKAQAEALLRIGRHVVSNSLADRSEFAVARDLLMRCAPKIGDEPLQLPNESPVDAAVRVVRKMQAGVLAIQGPPGTGKTYTAARMICALVRDKKKIGIAAGSHKVIRNVLDEVAKVAEDSKMALQCVQKCPDGLSTTRIECIDDNDDALTTLKTDHINVGAATAWFWARQDACESVDVMFVDEAAQISLPNVLAISQACRSIVLLGDPQQLEQPTKGSHPDDANVSALEHLINGKPTIGTDEGLFLDVTWRLHPRICSFTSEVFYEGRLGAQQGLKQQIVRSQARINGSGLRLIEVEHTGNQSDSPEEVEAVAQLVAEVLQGKSTWVDREGVERAITLNDILIIAPYNAQVFELQARIPGARIGTVDKFQGQEAPIVIYSMTTSSHADAPRGMEFLYSLNRLNVATSRAKCLCLLVASPELFAPECRSPRQMQLANAFCRYLELTTAIEAQG